MAAIKNIEDSSLNVHKGASKLATSVPKISSMRRLNSNPWRQRFLACLMQQSCGVSHAFRFTPSQLDHFKPLASTVAIQAGKKMLARQSRDPTRLSTQDRRKLEAAAGSRLTDFREALLKTSVQGSLPMVKYLETKVIHGNMGRVRSLGGLSG